MDSSRCSQRFEQHSNNSDQHSNTSTHTGNDRVMQLTCSKSSSVDQRSKQFLENKVSSRLFFRDGKRKIDFVLAYEVGDSDENRAFSRQQKRELYERNLKGIGLMLERESEENSIDGKTVFVKVHIPWEVMCRGAEEIKIKMPIELKSDMPSKVLVYERISEDSESFKQGRYDIGDIRIIREVDMQGRSINEKLASMCCSSILELPLDLVPKEIYCYTIAFRYDRMDKFIFPANQEDFFNTTHRTRVVDNILNRCRYDDRKSHQVGISRLIANGSYTAAFPLHDRLIMKSTNSNNESNEETTEQNDRQLLYEYWARPSLWYRRQPLHLIRKYFGEKIGLYFAWLGLYTLMLIPAAIMGLFVFFYGLFTMHAHQPIVDLCERKLNFPMCPKCDKKCPYTSLADSCLFAKVTYVIDNNVTVAFAVFMSFWATFFLELWKRKQAVVQYKWDLLTFEDEEERPRPDFEAAVSTLRLNPVTQEEEPFIPNKNVCPRYTVGINIVIFMVVLVVIAILSVVVYRTAVYAAIVTTVSVDVTMAMMISSSSAALLNLIAIVSLNLIYERLAYALTEWEMPKTQTKFDDLFTFKLYLFQFVNYYGSLFYIAFFKLTPGTPRDYNRVFSFRQEECHPAGCLFELGIQLSVIMVGLQVANNFKEVVIPKLLKWYRSKNNVKDVEETEMAQWELDYHLVDKCSQVLFYEYLEMVIQFGFIGIFIAAFPLGPLFALINNLIELRIDAYKFVTLFRRPTGQRVPDIGIWFEILTGVAKISVVSNAFVIGFVSEYVPRIYYRLVKSDNGSLQGFLNHSLACFHITDFRNDSRPDLPFPHRFNDSCVYGKQMCRYRGYYQPPFNVENNNLVPNLQAYQHSPEHWEILAARLFFVIVFEHFVFTVSNFIMWIVPDIPRRLHLQIKRENYLAREEMDHEKESSSRTANAVRMV